MEENYFDNLTEENMLFVYFHLDRGEVISFTVKLICDIDGQRYEVVRHDSGHGCPHKDILDTEGHVIRPLKSWYNWLNNNQALTLAIADIKENHQFYRERFIKWLRSDQQQKR
jgi:hypothetical protein